jgi:L-alanine-DL-glutamate epimerase-like enolase superfamily enzyme
VTYQVSVKPQLWRLNKPFKISREEATHAKTIICEIADGDVIGRGEAAGVSYKGETIESILWQVEDAAPRIAHGITRQELQSLMPAGGARNAVDCALWDLEAKRHGKTVWEMIGWDPGPVTTVYTVGIDTPENMRRDAEAHNACPIIKVKVGIGDPLEQIAAIKDGAPDATILVDANQAWSIADLERYAAPMKELGVAMIEQPIASTDDETLRNFDAPVPICADESCSVIAGLERLVGLYSMVNIKLDKSGGLTEALALAKVAQEVGFELMVGNMLGSSLAMAPAFVIAQRCRYVDIDGPLLQADDCDHGMNYSACRVEVFKPELWG